MLDSGAYSAATSGKVIELQKYIDDCLALMQSPKPPSVVFGLDVIGDPEKSARNCDEMRRQGVDALETFHYGSPWHYLAPIAKRGRMAFGGLVQRGKGGHGTKLTIHARLRFLEQCFARAWPVWAHGFGCCDQKILSRLPLASADSTTWVYGLQRYGQTQYMNISKATLKESQSKVGFDAAVRGQIQYYRELEDRTQFQWSKTLAANGFNNFRLRFVVSSKADKARFENYFRNRITV